MKKLFFMFLLAGVAFTASAQSTRQIHGAVVDQKTGNPLPGARVESTGGAESTVTDADGTFTLEVSRWLKSLTATYPGMNKKKKSVKDSEVIFRMRPKQKMAWFANLVGNVTFYDQSHGEMWTPGMGVMFGQVGKWGWYGKFMCDFKGPSNLERTNYRATNNPGSEAIRSGRYWDAASQYVTWSSKNYADGSENTPIYYDEKGGNIKPGLTFTAGGIKSIVPNVFYGFLGVGYTTAYKHEDQYTETVLDPTGTLRSVYAFDGYTNNATHAGLAFDGGFILRFNHVNAMLGFTMRFGEFWDPTYTGNIGVGYVF